MKNKHVGFLIIGMAVIFFLIVMSFNNALDTIVNTTCTHGSACPMHVTLKTQEIVSYSLIGLLVAVGLLVSFFIKDEKEVIHREIHKEIIKGSGGLSEEERKEERKKKLANLDEEERKVMNIVLREEGSVFQSALVKETGLSKVGVTRLLDRLEGKSLIERKRRGMTNIIILK